jgi:hypothetical protein
MFSLSRNDLKDFVRKKVAVCSGNFLCITKMRKVTAQALLTLVVWSE